MALTSFWFIGFIALAFVLYAALPGKARWVVLLAASLLFYASFGLAGLGVMVALCLAAWGCALGIERLEERKSASLRSGDLSKEEKKSLRRTFSRQEKGAVALLAVLCVGSLFLFKYYPPLAAALSRRFGIGIWRAENLILPMGISFFTLQLIGYVVDVSRGVARAERNPLKVLLYGSFFLSIMQGPFHRWNDLMPQLTKTERPDLHFQAIKMAGLRILWGYIKKMAIADQMAVITGEVFGHCEKYAGLAILLGAFCFAVQLYADFSGYMDIVSGVGELFGIRLPLNFDRPFFSRSISEFWRRWHITLGAWLKDYVFYPLLKSKLWQRMGKWLGAHLGKEAGRQIPTYLGMLILWTLIGAWHGAGFHYVFGVGLLPFLYIFLGEIAKPVTDRLKKLLHIKDDSRVFRVFQSLRVTALMIFAWVFFNASSFGAALSMLGRVFAGIPSLGQIKEIFLGEGTSVIGLWPNWLLYILLCAGALILADALHERGIAIRESVERRPYLVRMLFYLALIFTLVIFGAYGDQYDARDFIYFGF